MIRVAIVDDEPLAREGLRLRLARHDGVEIVGEAADGESAVALIQCTKPDLLFLDVQMPGMDGFETLACLAEKDLPLVVFVTAYDAYAVEAFDVCALDYLLKPVDDARLAEALRRARRELARGASAAAPDRVARLLDLSRPSPTRFVARERGRFRLVPIDTVRWIESAENYVRLHTAEGDHLVRMTLAAAEAALAERGFARIHRTRLVRTACVRDIRPTPGGDFRVLLDDGVELAMSRRYRAALLPRGRVSDARP